VALMHLYRITVRNEDWTVSAEEAEAANLRLVAKINDQRLELVVVERIDPSTAEVVVFAVR